MAKTNTTTTTPASKAHNYQASEATAALLDCIIAAQALYNKIGDALQLRYGAEKVDQHTPAYLEATSEIEDLLYQELQGQVIEGLMCTENVDADTTII